MKKDLIITCSLGFVAGIVNGVLGFHVSTWQYWLLFVVIVVPMTVYTSLEE